MIELVNVHKSFGKLHVLKGIDLEVADAEKIVIIGPSGCGKSTLIRCINLLERPEEGQVIVDGVDMTDKKTNIVKARQHIGMVFQQFNLYPHLSIIDNLTLAPRKIQGLGKAEAEEKAMRYLTRVGLADKRDAFPVQLSGGQQQRVAIARALTMEPNILLFDEPTSALDPEMIGEVLDVILKLSDEGITMVIVTHEMNFARKIADRVIFMSEGQILEEGPPEEVFDRPIHERTKQFLSKILA